MNNNKQFITNLYTSKNKKIIRGITNGYSKWCDG